MPLYVVFDLSAKLTPQRAVAELEGLRFKRTERRMKRYSRGAAMAEAVLDGPLRVMQIKPVATSGDALLLDRRYTSMAEFPWTSHMDTEALVLQHTTWVTHRVSLVCEAGLEGAGTESVRIEWDFASGKRPGRNAGPGDDDHAERVDWLLGRLDSGTDASPAASLTLTRLLRQHKGAARTEANGEGTATEAVWVQDDEAPGAGEADGSGRRTEGAATGRDLARVEVGDPALYDTDRSDSDSDNDTGNDTGNGPCGYEAKQAQ